jgi:hypothetical protein
MLDREQTGKETPIKRETPMAGSPIKRETPMAGSPIKRETPMADDPSPDTDLVTTIAAAVAAAMGPILAQMQASQAQTIQTLIEGQKAGQVEAVKAARAKRPESYLGDFPYLVKSHWSPDGTPLPALRCESFLGYWEEDETSGALAIIAGYPYVADEFGGCTREERDLLNSLQAGVYKATRRDGTSGVVRVQIKHDTDGAPTRLVVAVPKTWLTKQTKNTIGGIEFLRQLVPGVAVPIRETSVA